jgi:hypothetical protein
MNKSIVALKNAATIGALAFVLVEPTRAQSVGETEKGQILTIQKQWADARVKPDIAYLERLYAKRHQGLEYITCPNKQLEAVLKRTLGVSLFQEQVMSIAMGRSRI